MIPKARLDEVADYIWSESYRRLPGFDLTRDVAEDVLGQQLTEDEVLYIYDAVRQPR